MSTQGISYDFSSTTVGKAWIENHKVCPIDALLDYYNEMKKLLETEEGVNRVKCYHEIAAVKEILKEQTK